jgi:hypothetical protein
MIKKYLGNAAIVHLIMMVAYFIICRIIYDQGGQDDPVGNSIRVWMFFIAHIIITNFVVVARYHSPIKLSVRLLLNNLILAVLFCGYIFFISALISHCFKV